MHRVAKLDWFIVVALSSMPWGRPAAAQVQWPQNGHWYEAVYVPPSIGIRWGQAQAAALNAGGHLATVTSAAENAFVFELAGDPLLWAKPSWGPLIGGYRQDGAGGPAMGWNWVTGEPWGYTAWSQGQPDNQGGDENRLHFFSRTGRPAPTWNDSGGLYLAGFVVEYETAPISGQPAKSTFEQGHDGWAACGDTNHALLRWQSSQTSPRWRGSVYIVDAQEGRAMAFLAPRAFLGNKLGAYGGAIAFDLKPDNKPNLGKHWDVALCGQGMVLFTFLDSPQQGVWNHRSARLHENAEWRLLGTDRMATREELIAVLGNVTALLINGEYHDGADTTFLDDVVIATRVDFDEDADVDADDLVRFQACTTGPAIRRDGSPECVAADIDGDEDVDQADFGLFQRCYSGPGTTADLGCVEAALP